METKYMTKTKLITVNNRAKKAGGKHIAPEFVATLPERFEYPVCLALPFPMEKGWYRCWVTVGADDPVVSENIHTLLVDMPQEVLDKLPSLREVAAVTG